MTKRRFSSKKYSRPTLCRPHRPTFTIFFSSAADRSRTRVCLQTDVPHSARDARVCALACRRGGRHGENAFASRGWATNEIGIAMWYRRNFRYLFASCDLRRLRCLKRRSGPCLPVATNWLSMLLFAAVDESGAVSFNTAVFACVCL